MAVRRGVILVEVCLKGISVRGEGLFSVADQFATLVKVKRARPTEALLQFGPCPVQPDFNGAKTDFEDFRNRRIFELFYITQKKNHLLIFRKLLNVYPNALIHFMMNYLMFYIRKLLPGSDLGTISAKQNVFKGCFSLFYS